VDISLVLKALFFISLPLVSYTPREPQSL